MTKKRNRKKRIWILLLICALFFILFLNVMTLRRSVKLSNAAGAAVTSVVHSTWIHTHIRKLGHTGEFFLLGIPVYACFGWKKGLPICVAVSLLDQSFKVLIPGRHFDWTDLPFDVAGYVVGMFVMWILMRVKNRSAEETEGKVKK